MKENQIDKRKIIITIIATLLVLSIIGVVAYAEFTKSSRAKRVVASNDSADALFSSNYLLKHTGISANDVKNSRTVYVSEAGNKAVCRITLCNYAQGNKFKTYDGNIVYSLTAKLVTVTTNNGVKTMTLVDSEDTNIGARTVTVKNYSYIDSTTGDVVTISDEDATPVVLSRTNPSVTFSPTAVLTGGTSNSDVIVFEFSEQFNEPDNTYYLYVTAEPVNGAADVFQIDCLLNTGVSVAQQSLDWSGRINERGAQSGTGSPAPTEYDGFRYVVEGTGVGSFTLKWDATKLVISKIFLNQLGVSEPEPVNGWKSLTFSVDSDNGPSRYDLQFYYADGVSGTITNWASLEHEDAETHEQDGYIRYVYVPNTGETTPGEGGGEG